MTEQAAARAQPRRSGDWIASALAGGALIAAGVALGLDRLDVIDVSVGELVWPVVLVVVGGALAAVGQRLRGAAAAWRSRSAASADAGVELAERATAVLGEAHLTVSPDGDRDRASVPVSAVAVLGSVQLRVPAGWAVRDRASTLLGEVKLPADLATAQGAPTVELHGLAMLGSIEVVVDGR